MQSQSELFQIVFALCATSRLTCLLDSRQQECNQHGNDRYNNQQFDSSEPAGSSIRPETNTHLHHVLEKDKHIQKRRTAITGSTRDAPRNDSGAGELCVHSARASTLIARSPVSGLWRANPKIRMSVRTQAERSVRARRDPSNTMALNCARTQRATIAEIARERRESDSNDLRRRQRRSKRRLLQSLGLKRNSLNLCDGRHHQSDPFRND